MNLRLALSAAALSSLVLCASARDAHALGPVDLEIAAKAGAGTNPAPSGAPNPLGFGVGARAGVALLGFYGGLNVVNYFGQDNGLVSTHALQYGIEAGFGLTLLALTIRPQVGLGNISFSSSVDGSGLSVSNSNIYVEPGVTGLISLGGTFFIGIDLNALIIPGVSSPTLVDPNASSTYTAFTAHGQLGVKFLTQALL